MQWAKLASSGIPPSPRCSHSATLLDASLYIFGGRGATGELSNELFVLDIGGLVDINADEDLRSMVFGCCSWGGAERGDSDKARERERALTPEQLAARSLI